MLVSADRVLARYLQRALQDCAIHTKVLADARAAAALAIDCDAIIFDLGGADARRQLRRLSGSALPPLLAVLGLGSSAAGQEDAIARGAQLLGRPLSQGALAAALRRVFAEQRGRRLLSYHQQRDSWHAGLAQLTGESTPMLRLRAKLRLLLDQQWQEPAAAPRVVLLHGETGSGKFHAARALHGDGPRSGAGFVCFDGRGLSAAEIEARLFGADQRRPQGLQAREDGLLALAEGGTLFIREIADIPHALQTRLAERLDAAPASSAGWAVAGNVLLVAGSRRSPEQIAASGALSPALVAGPAASAFVLPPLRERGDDVCTLARQFIRAMSEDRGLPLPTWGHTVRPALLHHHWPGNVRELQHAMEHALLVQRDGVIDGADLRLGPLQPSGARAPAADLELSQIEHAALTRALERSRGNVSKAARLLGITRDTLRYRMAKRGLNCEAGHHEGAAPR